MTKELYYCTLYIYTKHEQEINLTVSFFMITPAKEFPFYLSLTESGIVKKYLILSSVIFLQTGTLLFRCIVYRREEFF